MRLKIVDRLYKKQFEKTHLKALARETIREISPFYHSNREEIVLCQDGV